MVAIDKTAIFLGIVIYACAMIAVDAACADRNEENNSTSDSTVDKVSNFFMEVGCTLKSGAERVKERVEHGYNYLKSKITSDEVKNATDAPSTDSYKDDRITFRDDDASPSNLPTEQSSTILPDVSGNATGIEVGTRNALTAPEMCQDDEATIDGKCREVVQL